MDSRQIDQFLAVFETHNLHEAAEQLYMTQQGLSRSIKKLEDELGATLFQRTSTGVRPTPQAEFLYPYAIDARRRLDQAVQGLHSPSWTKRQLSLPCSAGVLHILHPLLMEFEQSHPDVHVSWKDHFPVDRILSFYDFKDIDQALADSHSGKIIKAVLRISEQETA